MACNPSRRPGVAGLAARTAPPAAAAAAARGPREFVRHLNRPGGGDFAHDRQIPTDVRNLSSIVPPWGLEIRIVMPGPRVDMLR